MVTMIKMIRFKYNIIYNTVLSTLHTSQFENGNIPPRKKRPRIGPEAAPVKLKDICQQSI